MNSQKSYLKFSVIFTCLIVGIAGCKITPPTNNRPTASKSIYSQNPTTSYYKFYNDKPDIKPQQVNKITWQEGQSPQIISVKKW